MKKVAQINSTIKVSSTFSMLAGFQRAAPFGRPPQRAKSPYFKKTEQGVRNAKAFRGGATTTAPPFSGTDLLNFQNVPVERFGQSKSPKLFVQFVQTKYLFRQSEPQCTFRTLRLRLTIYSQSISFLTISSNVSLLTTTLLLPSLIITTGGLGIRL